MVTQQEGGSAPHRRRPRYSGKHPRRFEEKYKEHDPSKYGETVAKVLASGKTPAGTHRPIMVEEVLAALAPKPGGIIVDCTLGYGGHAARFLEKIQPGGRLIGLDADPLELPKTEARLRAQGHGAEHFTAVRSNFAGIAKALSSLEVSAVDGIFADLGVSSMQLDDPARGFTFKGTGPLDMRMNPSRGQTASALLEKADARDLARLFAENADEPSAEFLGAALAGKKFGTTAELASAIHAVLKQRGADDRQLAVRRIFQALRIAVNDEFSALETLLRSIPALLKPGGVAAILTFHSGEDRRVKKSFQAGYRDGIYSEISDVIWPTPEERRANPRSSPAKLRWVRKALDAS